ncbi:MULTISPECIES: ABC transporter permease subunit [Streptomyces]|uniref:ABC transporter permease subunit n=1 Tax=Streptomyces flaveolus TaxID=67297 RepID=A0ABV3AQG3_9ACTN|nr:MULTISPECIES: ABC transporter permease subunit [Streptomyces]KMS75886.1 ABC transporter [Streptomyces regensis]
MTGARTSPAGTGRVHRGPRLGGLNWLVWRQHRAAFWTLIGGTVIAAGWMVYQRMGMMDTLHALGWPHPKSDDWDRRVGNGALTMAGYGLGFLPVLIGVFIGAPLIAGDLENGTAKLVTSQSVSRIRWIATKLGVTVLVVLLGTVVLSQVFGWWWSPVRDRPNFMPWTEGTVFDNTGPVLTALTLFTLVGGVAIGMVLRRTLLSMVVTFGFAVTVQILWSHFRLQLGNPVSLTTHTGVMKSSPSVPSSAFEVDTWFTTASGKLYGWGTCVTGSTEKSQQACLDKKGIVGWRVDYLPFSQLSSMQWFGASVLLTLSVAVTAFIFVWGRKRVA